MLVLLNYCEINFDFDFGLNIFNFRITIMTGAFVVVWAKLLLVNQHSMLEQRFETSAVCSPGSMLMKAAGVAQVLRLLTACPEPSYFVAIWGSEWKISFSLSLSNK